MVQVFCLARTSF